MQPLTHPERLEGSRVTASRAARVRWAHACRERRRSERCESPRTVPGLAGRSAGPLAPGELAVPRASLARTLPRATRNGRRCIASWVSSLPFALRVPLAYHHDLTLAVHAVAARVIEGFYRDKGRALDITNPRTGCITAVQRFGSDLALNSSSNMHSSRRCDVDRSTESSSQSRASARWPRT